MDEAVIVTVPEERRYLWRAVDQHDDATLAFDELANLGPRNFFDVHPFLTLEVLQPLTLTADWNFYSRQSVEDGIYGPSGNLIRSPEGSRSRYVGSAISLTADWQINRRLNLTTIYAHFFPGSFLRETGPAEPIEFIEFTLSLTF